MSRTSPQNDKGANVSFMAAVVASISLSIMSGLTTLAGLWEANSAVARDEAGQIIQDASITGSAFDVAITVFLALGVQLGMLATAWLLSYQLFVRSKRHWGQILGTLFVYLAATTVSVTFSYMALLDNMFQADKASWSSDTMREQGEIIVAELEEEVRIAYDVARSDFANMEGTFNQTLTTLADAAQAKRQDLLAQVAAKEVELAALEDEIARSEVEAQSGEESKTRQLSALNTQLQEKIAARAPLITERQTYEATVGEHTGQANELLAQMALEEGGARGEGRSDGGLMAGRGPRWRALNEELRIVETRLEVAQRQVTRVSQSLTTIDGDIETIRANILTLQTQEDGGPVASANEIERTRLLETLAALQTEADKFQIELLIEGQELTETELARIEETCISLRAELAEDLDPTRQIECSSPETYQILRQHSRLSGALSHIRTQCFASENPEFAALNGAAILAYIGTECVDKAELSASRIADYKAQIRTISRSRDPSASPIAYAFAALADGEAQARFCMIMALVADLLILGISLIGNASRRSDMEAAPVATSSQREKLLDWMGDKDEPPAHIPPSGKRGPPDY